MTPPKKDLYRTLGIRPNSSAETVKKAYRKKAMKYHPDRNPGDEAAAAEYHAVQLAFDVLSDPDRRARYDATGDESAAPTGSAESDVLNTLHPIVMAVLAELGSADPESVVKVDVVAEVAKRLDSQIKTVEQTAEEFERRRRTLAAAVGRITRGGAPDPLLDAALRNQLAQMDAAVRAIGEDLDKFVRVRNYLKECAYRTDGPAVPFKKKPAPGMFEVVFGGNASSSWGRV